MHEDKIKEAFAKAKQDIFFLQSEIFHIREQIKELKRTLDRQSDRQTLRHPNQTQEQESKTIISRQTDTSTHNLPLKALKSPNIDFSTRNEGVSTDRQTIRQTDTSTRNEGVPNQKFAQEVRNTTHETMETIRKNYKETPDVSKVISSLDAIKASLKSQFKSLTKQEFLVFSTIYQLEEQGFTVDYTTLAEKLKLTESSIRDYVQRILDKKIPVQKYKENNKKVTLFISPELKKLASLQTLMELREI